MAQSYKNEIQDEKNLCINGIICKGNANELRILKKTS